MKLTSELVNQITQFFDADIERLQTIFEGIYQNPELGFIETRTSDNATQEFKSLGYEGKTEIGKTGVVGIIKNGDVPIVMSQVDMDAIAVKEETGCSTPALFVFGEKKIRAVIFYPR